MDGREVEVGAAGGFSEAVALEGGGFVGNETVVLLADREGR